jgi:hypothetical protein
MKKFIACLSLIIGLCFVTVSSANASVAAMQALQNSVGRQVELKEVSSCFQMYLGKKSDGSVWLYKVYKSKPSNNFWNIEKIRMFKN